MNKTILIIVIVLVVIVGGYFLLRGGYQASKPISTPAPASTPASIPAPVPSPSLRQEAETPSVKEFAVSGTEYSFSPSSITVSAGERVKITFRNEGRIGHDFAIKDLGIKTSVIGPGRTDTVEFIAPASGTYAFICSVPGHATAGMVGDLKVE